MDQHSPNWVYFCNEIEEDPPSLHKYDLIDFAKADEPLRKTILTEGIVIYAQQ